MDYRAVWAVHQPFTYSRTAMLLDDFARVLQIADHVVLSEIMGSREKKHLQHLRQGPGGQDSGLRLV